MEDSANSSSMLDMDDPSTLNDPEAIKRRHNAMRLQKIHHDYRVNENSKRTFHIDAETMMRQQQALLDNLESDNRALQEIVDTYVIKDYRKQMDDLMDKASKYTELIEMETKNLHDLESKIQETEEQEIEAKRKMGGCKAPWTKHRMNIIHTQIHENRIHRAKVASNMHKNNAKKTRAKMVDLKKEHEFYDTVYSKLKVEHDEWESKIEECITNTEDMYEDRTEYQNELSDLIEMDDYKNIYHDWLEMEGWTTQEPYMLKELESSKLNCADADYTEAKDSNEKEEKKAKDPVESSKKSNEKLFPKFTNKGDRYKTWVDSKALENIMEVLGVENVSEIADAIGEAQIKHSEIFEDFKELLKELDELDDSAKNQQTLYDDSVPETADPNAANYVVYNLKHLDLEDETYSPLLAEMRKQIIGIFKEAGCQDISTDGSLADEEIFLKLESFVRHTVLL